MISDFYFGRWLAALLWVAWLGLSIAEACVGAETWWGRLAVFVLLLLAGLLIYFLVGVFSRLLAAVFITPFRWALARRAGIHHGSSRWASRTMVRRHIEGAK